MRRRTVAGVVAVASLAVSLAACGQSAAPAKKPAPSTSKLTPGTGKPTSASSDAVSPADLLFYLKSRYHVDYPISDACPAGVAYDDVSCGRQLAALNQIGQVMVRAISKRIVSVPDAGKLQAAEQTMDKSFTDAQRLGCYGLGTQPSRQSRRTLETLCPDLGRLAMEYYLVVETDAETP